MRLHWTATCEDLETSTPTMRFLPWEVMTAQQQAEHLVYAHGFDDADAESWWRDAYPDTPLTNAAVVAYYRDVYDGVVRALWHDDDHGQYPHGGSPRFQHTHDKPLAQADAVAGAR